MNRQSPGDRQCFINLRRLENGLVPLAINVQFTLNIGCNAKCLMCDGRKFDISAQFSYSSILKLIDYLDSSIVASIKLLGGEPLLDRGGLLEVVKKCKEKKINLTMNTNGYFLNKNYIDDLARHGIKELSISLHATGKNHDSILNLPGLFKKNILNMIYIKNKYPWFKIKVESVIMKNNIQEIIKLQKFINSLRIFSWTIRELEDFGKNYSNLRASKTDIISLQGKLRNLKLVANLVFLNLSNKINVGKKKKCSYLLARININNTGKIIPCLKNDDSNFYLNAPIEELYSRGKFKNYILNKINSCGEC